MIRSTSLHPGLVRYVAALGLLLAPTGAAAATNQARNRCNDAIRILRSNPSMIFKDREVDPLETQNAVAHWNQVLDGWNRASGKINEIPKAELNKEDPDLKECFEVVLGWGAYIKDLKLKLDAAQKLGAVVGPFLAEVKPYERSFYTLAAAHLDGTADVLNNYKLPDARKLMDELAAAEKVCEAKVPDAGKEPPTLPRKQIGGQEMRVGGVSVPTTLAKSPDAWCYVARNRVKLMTVALGNRTAMAEGYGNWALMIPDTLKKLEGGEGWMEAWIAEIASDPSDFKAKLKKASEEWYRGLGIAMPAEPFGGLDKLLAELRAKIDEKAPTLQFPALTNHDGAIEGGARSALGKIFPKAKVVKAVMDSPDWTVEKNGLGVPLNRFRSGQLLFKVPPDKWCRQRTFSYVETYTGGGQFQKSSVVQVLPASRFVPCD